MPHETYRLTIDPSLSPSPVVPALIWAEGIRPPEGPLAFLSEVVAATAAKGEGGIPETVRSRVRDMLRHGRYKPTGRGKPASEFLLRAALEGTFPRVNGPVDVNNAISLASGLPGSIFDADLSGPHLLLRRGKSGEAYVFNPSGQTIDLEDLLLVCRKAEEGWEPCGNPVKDAMATKVRPETGRVVAVLYAPIDEPVPSVEGWAARYADLLKTHCRAERSGFEVVCP